MIDEIDYFPKRDKYKKKKGVDSGEEWNALKKTKVDQEAKEKSKGQKNEEGKTGKPKKPEK